MTLFDQITDFNNLYAAYKSAASGKHDRAEVLRHDLHAEKILWQLRWELKNGRYRHGTYRHFVVVDPKARDVHAAPFTDRIVHHALVRQIEPLFEKSFIYSPRKTNSRLFESPSLAQNRLSSFNVSKDMSLSEKSVFGSKIIASKTHEFVLRGLYDSYACRKDKGSHRATLRLQCFLRSALNQNPRLYVLRADIRKYFASIDYASLQTILARKIHDSEVLRLLGTIINSYHTPENQNGLGGGADL